MTTKAAPPISSFFSVSDKTRRRYRCELCGFEATIRSGRHWHRCNNTETKMVDVSVLKIVKEYLP